MNKIDWPALAMALTVFAGAVAIVGAGLAVRVGAAVVVQEVIR